MNRKNQQKEAKGREGGFNFFFNPLCSLLFIALCAFAALREPACAGEWYTPQQYDSVVTITGTGPLLVGGTNDLAWGLMSTAYGDTVYISGTAGSCVSMDGWGTNNTLIVRASGVQGAAIVTLSQTGAPGQVIVQQLYYTAPALQVIRDYVPATDGTGTATAPLVQVAANDETPDSVPVATFKRCGLSGDNGVIVWPDGSLTLKSAYAPTSPDTGRVWFDPATHHFMGWNGTAAVQLDN